MNADPVIREQCRAREGYYRIQNTMKHKLETATAERDALASENQKLTSENRNLSSKVESLSYEIAELRKRLLEQQTK